MTDNKEKLKELADRIYHNLGYKIIVKDMFLPNYEKVSSYFDSEEEYKDFVSIIMEDFRWAVIRVIEGSDQSTDDFVCPEDVVNRYLARRSENKEKAPNFPRHVMDTPREDS